MRIDANLFEVMRGIGRAYRLSRAESRALRRVADNEPGVIETAELSDGELLFNLRDVRDWLNRVRSQNLVPVTFTPLKPEKWVHTEDLADVGAAAKLVSISRSTLWDAANRNNLPSVSLAFGTQLVHVDDVRNWHKAYFVKKYRHDGRSLSLSEWARETNIPSGLLHERVNKRGQKIGEAIQAGGQKGGRQAVKGRAAE